MNSGAERPAGDETRTPFRVRYPETDRMGVAYHAHYLVWFEIGRTELMRALGFPYGLMEEVAEVFFPVVQLGARYRQPARYDEELTVCTRIGGLSGARVRFDYRVVRGDGSMLASGFTEHAAIGRNGRPRRLPAELHAQLELLRSGG